MKCHYEVLEVREDADDIQIKASYRRLALLWHPDKNIGNIDEAKEKFQLIQQAYEVLSDSQERAWYDRHKDQILRGSQTNYEDASLDVYQYFTASCYKGYGDDEAGFYNVYGDIFHQIATEDLEFMDDEEEFDRIPTFGTSTSDYESVVGPFYGYWQSYSTKKSYSWLCLHNINEIRDRRILREVEKETKKLAQKARKERNEEIRALVGFVRKRDKRVHQYKIVLEEKAEQNRIKQDQKRLEQIRKNRLEVAKMADSTVFKVDDYEDMLRQIERTYASSDEDECKENDEDVHGVVNGTEDLELNDFREDDEYIDRLYCVICNKCFKNESSYKNHEISKKHLNNLEKLKREMIDDEADSEDAVEIEVAKKPKKSKKKIRRIAQAESENEDDEIVENDNYLEDADENEEVEVVKKSKKSKKKNRKVVQVESESEEIEVEPVVSDSEIEKSDKIEKPKKSAKAKRAKKKEEKSIDPTCVPKVSSKSNEIVVETDHTCVTCQSIFESKNKLFTHLKKTNHGVYISKDTTTTTNTKKSKHRK